MVYSEVGLHHECDWVSQLPLKAAALINSFGLASQPLLYFLFTTMFLAKEKAAGAEVEFIKSEEGCFHRVFEMDERFDKQERNVAAAAAMQMACPQCVKDVCCACMVEAHFDQCLLCLCLSVKRWWRSWRKKSSLC